jgi:hypothetical protein
MLTTLTIFLSLVELYRKRGMLCQTAGSSGGSAICNSQTRSGAADCASIRAGL